MDRATNDSAAVLAIPGPKGTGSPVLESVDRRAVRTATSFDLAPTELAVPRPEDPQRGYDQDMSSTRQSGHETPGFGSSRTHSRLSISRLGDPVDPIRCELHRDREAPGHHQGDLRPVISETTPMQA